MDDDLLAEHVDAIHAVAPQDFVAERTARARQLRQDGHREEATALTRHRKPTVAAWAVNQLARRHADAVDRLVEAGGDLRAAQVRATSGRGADGLRSATQAVRGLAGDLATLGDAILDEVGAGDHHAEVEQTLFAAAVDPDLHDRLRRGVFERPVEATGFGDLTALVSMPGGAQADAEEGAGPDEAEPDEAAVARRRELEDRRADLQRAVLRQQRRADQARDRAAELQARADELRARAEEAATEADGARVALDELAGDLAAVERELDSLDGAGG